MKKSEFIAIYMDAVGKGRVKNFPDMRVSEIAASRVHDAATALKMWRKYRYSFKTYSEETLRAKLTPKP